jgi:hypothetical protein
LPGIQRVCSKILEGWKAREGKIIGGKEVKVEEGVERNGTIAVGTQKLRANPGINRGTSIKSELLEFTNLW